MSKWVCNHKLCPKCHLNKHKTEYIKDSYQASGFSSYCKECLKVKAANDKIKHAIRNKRYRERNKLKRENIRLFKRYGITANDYSDLLLKQEGVCYICKKKEKRLDYRTKHPSKLTVDHCHKTGKVRSLLCNRCNTLLGKCEESIDLLHETISYIKKFNYV